ncbi:hypothetical protein Fmac_026159 [Flemingia macrophylla]|uniref:Secreted protein n=1 Tax=Flemingia macrophylla TaxID=520843 RepID=A0ABD1LE24_9FABA
MFEEGSGSHNFDSKFILFAISVELLVIAHCIPTCNAMGKVCTKLPCYGYRVLCLRSSQLAPWTGLVCCF